MTMRGFPCPGLIAKCLSIESFLRTTWMFRVSFIVIFCLQIVLVSSEICTLPQDKQMNDIAPNGTVILAGNFPLHFGISDTKILLRQFPGQSACEK